MELRFYSPLDTKYIISQIIFLANFLVSTKKTKTNKSYQLLRWVTIWSQQTWAKKWGCLLCPFSQGSWVPI